MHRWDGGAQPGLLAACRCQAGAPADGHVVDFPPLGLEGCLSERASVWEQGCDDCVELIRGGHRFGEPLEGYLRVGTPLGCLRGCGR